MPSLSLTEEQVVALINQLRPEQKRTLLFALASDAQTRREERMALAQTWLRALAAERGLDWDALSDEQREAFVDQLVHEDR